MVFFGAKIFDRFKLKKKTNCPLCRYSFGEENSPTAIMQQSFKIIDLDQSVILQNVENNREEVHKICDQYFITQEFGMIE